MGRLTFDDWLVEQKFPPVADLTAEQLAVVRSTYEQVVASAPEVARWTPRARSSPTDNLYAVVVRDGADLWLYTWVRHSPEKNEFFMMIPRPDHSVDAHASLHAGGRFNLKGFGRLHWKRQRAKPDANFKGTVQLTMTPITLKAARGAMAVCDPAHFTDVFELSPSDIAGTCTVAVDLVERGGAALATPWSRIVKQRRYTAHVPEVLITIWEDRYKPGVSNESNSWDEDLS